MNLKLFDPLFEENHEFVLFIIMFFLSFFILFFTRNFNSELQVLIISIFQLPFIYKLLKYEESKDLSFKVIKSWKLHYRAIGVYLVLFFSVSLVSFFITLTPFANETFESQRVVVYAINNPLTGHFSQISVSEYLLTLVSNNLRVLSLSIFLSIAFGLGSLYLLNWNATIFGFVIGEAFKDNFLFLSNSNISLLFLLKPLLRYLIHGTLEILAYVIGAFAGGIIFAGLINHHAQSKVFKKILYDASDLVLIAIILLIAAAFVETFIAPFFI